MARNMDQSKIITHLNAYLKKQHLPCQLNDEGVCNGLAALYVQYALRGESAKFKEILSFLATGKANDEIVSKDEIDIFMYSFATKIVVTFNPQKYYPGLSQDNAVKLLDVEQETLKSSFCFSAVVNDDSWEKILQELSLKENEVLQVASVDHKISLRKTDQGYEVYDPNYPQVYKIFTDEAQLVHELHHKVFDYDKGNMGLELNVIRDPKDTSPRVYPQITNLYDKYLTDVNAVAQTSGKEFSTLRFATANNDESVINYLLAKNPDNILKAAARAAQNNYDKALAALVGKIPERNDVIPLLTIALRYGRQESAEKLFELLPNLSPEITSSDLELFVAHAAQGGNPQLLKRCIELFDEKCKETRYPDEKDAMARKAYISDLIQNKDHGAIIMLAIKSGSAETVRVLMNRLGESNNVLSDEEKLRYLSEAIRQNRYSVVECLIFEKPEISPELLNEISMTTKAVESTSILILNALKAGGMQFSAPAERIIAKHNEQSLKIIKSLGIALSKFTDFFREFLKNKEEKGIHIDSGFFKRKLQDIKPEPEVDFLEIESESGVDPDPEQPRTLCI